MPTIINLPPNGLESSYNITADSSRDGYEGVSVGLFESSIAAPDLWSPRDDFPPTETMNIQQRSNLSFSFTVLNQGPWTLQMPIANTIFQNGKSATLFAQRWIKKDQADGLICVEETNLPEQMISISKETGITDDILELHLHTRLRPITSPRVVSAAIGNIIRQIEVDDGHAQPASQELENAINKQIQSGHLQRDKVDVWALLRPPFSMSSDVHLGDKFDLQAAIASGAQLLKVLSGGGGWGEKQGLLALDPDSHYGGQVSPAYNDDEVFADIVKVGETVTFLVNDSVPLNNSNEVVAGEHLSSDTRDIALQDQLLEFGCLPSTMDVMPTPETGLNSSDIRGPHILINQYFGILSENGMSLTVRFFTIPLHRR